jgi:hypothetical protein
LGVTNQTTVTSSTFVANSVRGRPGQGREGSSWQWVCQHGAWQDRQGRAGRHLAVDSWLPNWVRGCPCSCVAWHGGYVFMCPCCLTGSVGRLGWGSLLVRQLQCHALQLQLQPEPGQLLCVHAGGTALGACASPLPLTSLPTDGGALGFSAANLTSIDSSSFYDNVVRTLLPPLKMWCAGSDSC